MTRQPILMTNIRLPNSDAVEAVARDEVYGR